MDDLFESAWLKWAWSVVDAEALADNVNLMASSQGKRTFTLATSCEYDAKRHGIPVVVTEIIDSFPPSWGLLLGNTVHNLRSSLDHLAWALYKRGKTPNLGERRERTVYFPIAYSPAEFRDQVRRKLPGVRRADLTIVRRCQPYMGGKRNIHRHFLVTLDKLSREDKHRTIQPVLAVPNNATLHLLDYEDCIVRRFAPRPQGRLEVGTELGVFYVKKTGPVPYVDVQPSFTVRPAINDRLPLQEFLDITVEAVRFVLSRFSPTPSSARSIIDQIEPSQAKLHPPR
jgi:hypothetical protein